MRSFIIMSLSTALLSGCLTTQKIPNYETSTAYRGDVPAQTKTAQTQYVTPSSASPTYVTYDRAPAQFISTPVTSYESAPAQPVIVQASSAETAITGTAPTDSLYNAAEITGTPGFMALQSANQGVTFEAVTPTIPNTGFAGSAPQGAAGTPVEYDFSRNIVAIDSVTTGQQLPEVRRSLGTGGQSYTVQQGDTVYSLSRKTCVGVNVIQSLNGLSHDYAIKIGQTLTLPQPVC